MSSISSLGVGSNLDLSSLLDRLAAAESQPLVALQKQQTSYTAKLSAYGTLRGALGTFQATARKLADVNVFQSFQATSSAADVVGALGSTSAVPGSYLIEVSQVASAQSLAALGVADAKAVIGQGTLTFDFGRISGGSLNAVSGQYSGAAFTADATRSAQTLVIDASCDSLEGLRDAINAKTALGVSASIVNDGGTSPYRLVLASRQTGETSSLRIGVAGDASLAALMANDPAGAQTLQQTRAAANAVLKVNGIAVTSASNTVADAVQGVSLSLLKAGSSTVSVARDTASIAAAATAFVSAYNNLLGTATVLTRYDAKTNSSAPLVGDNTLRAMQNKIRVALNTPQAGNLQFLSRIGVGFQKDGTLSLDSAVLTQALTQDAGAVSELLAGTAPGQGCATRLTALVEGFIASEGLLANATSGVNSTLKSLEGRYAATELSVQAKVARYRAQFTQLDLVVSRMNSTTSYLTQQFDNMNSSK